MDIVLENPYNISVEGILRALQKLNTVLNLQLQTLYLHLIADQDILKINKQYLHHNYFTDIITFDLRDSISNDAEIFISIDRARENANIIQVSFEQEFARVCIHGLLHLAGFKDKSISEKEHMTRLEDQYLDTLFHVKQK